MAIESLFTFKEGGTPTSYDPGDPDSYKQFIHAMITDSRDYENSVLAPKRDEAQKYYYGYLPSLNPNGSPYSDTLIVEDPNATYEEILGPGEGPSKSSFVSTDVRDAILMMLPSLVRIFAASENVISLVPRSPQDEAMAEQATNYVNYVFWQDNSGFLTLYGAFKDALTVKTGYVKWWTDNTKEIKRKQFVNITMEQLQMLLGEDPTAKVVPGSLTQNESGGVDVVIEGTQSKPITRVEGVPPEEMRLDRYARSFAKSRIVGHERIVSVDELTAMGYPRDLAANYVQTQDVHNFTMESMIRNPGRGMSTRVGDGVLYGEWYVRIDTDGDGVAELRYVCTMGEDHAIVADQPANRIKFAMFSCDPISHTLVGDSIADLTIDIQRIKTNMTRGVLDSLAESINPKTVVNELVTNLDDALNDDLGAVIRTRGDPGNAVQFATTPFVGQAALPILQYLDEVQQRRTGLSDAARGLDPKALQSSTMIGVEAVINGQQERTELVARVLAETGYRDLFHGLFNEIVECENQSRTLRVNGSWQTYHTSMFDADMSVEVNPTLGKGSDTVRMMTLQQIKTGPDDGVPAVRPDQSGGRHPRDAQHHHRHAGDRQHQERRPLLQDPAPAGSAGDAERAEGAGCDDHRRQGQLRAGEEPDRQGDGRPAVQRRQAGAGRGLPARQARPGAGQRGREDTAAGGAARPRSFGRHGRGHRRHGQGRDYRANRRGQRAAGRLLTKEWGR